MAKKNPGLQPGQRVCGKCHRMGGKWIKVARQMPNGKIKSSNEFQVCSQCGGSGYV